MRVAIGWFTPRDEHLLRAVRGAIGRATPLVLVYETRPSFQSPAAA
jgi:hypothetical protein